MLKIYYAIIISANYSRVPQKVIFLPACPLFEFNYSRVLPSPSNYRRVPLTHQISKRRRHIESITILTYMINQCYKHRFITEDFENCILIDVFDVAH